MEKKSFHFAVAKIDNDISSQSNNSHFTQTSLTVQNVQFSRQYNFFNYLIGHIYVMNWIWGGEKGFYRQGEQGVEKSGKIIPIAKKLNEIKSYWHLRERGRVKGKNGIFPADRRTFSTDTLNRDSLRFFIGRIWVSWGIFVFSFHFTFARKQHYVHIRKEKLNNWISNFKAIEDWFYPI